MIESGRVSESEKWWHFSHQRGVGGYRKVIFSTHVQRKGFFSRATEIVKASESRCSTFFPPLAAFCGSVGPVCRDIDPIAARAFSGSQRWKWLCCNFRLASHVRARNTTFTRSTADGQNGRSVAFFGCSDHVFLFWVSLPVSTQCVCVRAFN